MSKKDLEKGTCLHKAPCTSCGSSDARLALLIRFVIRAIHFFRLMTMSRKPPVPL